MYYIRKLSKLSTVNKLKSVSSIEDVPSDMLKQEWTTKKNTLSFWKCDSLDNCKDTMKAILLSTTSIEKCKFIIFDDAMLDECGIARDYSEKGKTGYSGFEDLHVNLCELTYGKIGRILSLTKSVIAKEGMTLELSKEKVKEYIKEVCDDGLLNADEVQEALLSDIKKYGLYAA